MADPLLFLDPATDPATEPATDAAVEERRGFESFAEMSAAGTAEEAAAAWARRAAAAAAAAELEGRRGDGPAEAEEELDLVATPGFNAPAAVAAAPAPTPTADLCFGITAEGGAEARVVVRLATADPGALAGVAADEDDDDEAAEGVGAAEEAIFFLSGVDAGVDCGEADGDAAGDAAGVAADTEVDAFVAAVAAVVPAAAVAGRAVAAPSLVAAAAAFVGFFLSDLAAVAGRAVELPLDEDAAGFDPAVAVFFVAVDIAECCSLCANQIQANQLLSHECSFCTCRLLSLRRPHPSISKGAARMQGEREHRFAARMGKQEEDVSAALLTSFLPLPHWDHSAIGVGHAIRTTTHATAGRTS